MYVRVDKNNDIVFILVIYCEAEMIEFVHLNRRFDVVLDVVPGLITRDVCT